MKITTAMSDAAIAEELFSRLESQRKALGLTQEEIAERVGITRKSYGALKQGVTKLATFIAILRQLEYIDNLELLAPTAERSPMAALLQSMGERRINRGTRKIYRPGIIRVKELKAEADQAAKQSGGKVNPIMARRQKLITKDG